MKEGMYVTVACPWLLAGGAGWKVSVWLAQLIPEQWQASPSPLHQACSTQSGLRTAAVCSWPGQANASNAGHPLLRSPVAPRP
eukprot:COSAG05_NODE_12192_length_479_cov_0.734211_1_plen_82_part_01